MGASISRSPAYSKLLLLVSCTRTRSSFAFGNALQPTKNLDAKILGRRNLLAKLRNLVIERAVIEGFEYFALNEAIEIGEIRDHASGWINVARQAYFQNIIMSVAMRVVAFAVEARIFRFA